MKRNTQANFARKLDTGYHMARPKSGGLAVKGAEKAGNRAYMAGAKARQAVSYVRANKGKAGLALAGLAAAGGLGMAGAKALGNARKPKSLQDRIKNVSKKMFR